MNDRATDANKRLQDEINQLKMDLDETLESLKCLVSASTKEVSASTKEGKQRLEDKVLEIKRALWGKERDLEWSLEENRVRTCVTECEELGITMATDPDEWCPICLEDIPKGKTVTFNCCGKCICQECDIKIQKQEHISDCPCCRAPSPETPEQYVKFLTKRAKKGCKHSQFRLGYNFEHGKKGFTVHLRKAAFWYNRSAEQGHTMAQCAIGRFYECGLGGCGHSKVVAEKFLALAAAKNDTQAQCMLAQVMKNNGMYSEALKWATLAAAQGDCTDGIAELVLAKLYCKKYAEGRTKSPARALYWAKKAALAGEKIGFSIVADLVKEVGTRCEYLYWLRQGTLQGCEIANKEKKEYESLLRSYCSGCSKPASSFPGKLKRCTRCLALCYCSKKCQVDDWTKGHKLLCYDMKGKPRFSVFPDSDWKDISQMSH